MIYILAFILTLVLLKQLSILAFKINLLDRPNSRKDHKGNIPLVGGLSIVTSFILTCLFSSESLGDLRLVFLAIIPLLIIGIFDDYGELSVKKRVLVQILSILIVCYYGDITITNLGSIFLNDYDIVFYYLPRIFTIICVLGVMNSINLIDGVDGVCGLVSLVSFLGLALILFLKELALFL